MQPRFADVPEVRRVDDVMLREERERMKDQREELMHDSLLLWSAEATPA
jgi:hypothetical protein